ncbi:uncharacterized protein LOC141852545 isoform X1 [Brevipalpus obovatus]
MAKPTVDQQFLSSLPPSTSQSSSSASPLSPATGPSSHPKWINPCSLPFYAVPTDSPDPQNIYDKVLQYASATKNYTEKVKQIIIKDVGDPEFEEGLRDIRQEWLPEIRPVSSKPIEEEDAFRKTFQYLQYYAVGLEQVLLDEIMYEGGMLNEYHEVEEYLTQLLCQVQLGMWFREISPDRHVGKNVMSQEYRDLPDQSKRIVRDYLIVRDFIKTSEMISQMFNEIGPKTNLGISGQF